MRVLNKISIFCSAVCAVISGCAAHPVVPAGIDLTPAIESAKNAGNSEGLIALDLVSALVQFREMDPSKVNLQLMERTSSFDLQVEEALTYAGYIRHSASDSMKTLFVVTTISPDRRLMPVSSEQLARTYQIKVANIIVKRDYMINEGQLEPASRIHLSGADVIRVNRDNEIFDNLPIDIAREEIPNADIKHTDQLRKESSPGKQIAQDTSLLSATWINVEVQLPGNAVSSTESWSNINKPSQLNLSVHTQNGLVVSEGDLMQLSVDAGNDSQIHCYYQDSDGQVARIFPNRYTPDTLVRASSSLVLPLSESWQLLATASGKSENFMCIAIEPQWSERLHIISSLPDLQPLAVSDLREVYDRYKDAIGNDLINESISIVVN